MLPCQGEDDSSNLFIRSNLRKKMQLQQTELASGNRRTICWLARDPRVRVGAVLSFAKDEQRWRVLRQYGAIEDSEIHRRWPAGGLH